METLEFLQRIYGNLREGFLTVTTLEKNGKSNTRWFEPGRLEEMLRFLLYFQLLFRLILVCRVSLARLTLKPY